MKLLKLISILQEKRIQYMLKYDKEPEIYAYGGDLYLCAKVTEKEPGYFVYAKPYMKLPKSISKVLEVGG